MGNLVVPVCAAVIRKNGLMLVCTRPEGRHLAGKWEFPGGKVHRGESLQECLEREIREELGVRAIVADQIFETTYSYPEKTVRIHFIRAFLDDDESKIHSAEGQKIMWCSESEIGKLDFLPADRLFLDFLRASRKDR